MVEAVVGFVVLKPGPGITVVPGLAVPVKTVATPSTQMMSGPVCEQVVDCAEATPGARHITMAVEALLSSARRAVNLAILKASLVQLRPAQFRGSSLSR